MPSDARGARTPDSTGSKASTPDTDPRIDPIDARPASSPSSGSADEAPASPPLSESAQLLAPNGKLSRTSRVRKRREFLRIQKRGVRVHSAAFTVVALVNPDEGPRVGCAVSKRVGNAVVRARVRRLIRETFRRLAHRLPAVDFVVIAKPLAKPLAKSGLWDVVDDLVPLLIGGARRAEQRARAPKRRRSRK